MKTKEIEQKICDLEDLYTSETGLHVYDKGEYTEWLEGKYLSLSSDAKDERLSKCCDYPIINDRCSRCLSDHSKPSPPPSLSAEEILADTTMCTIDEDADLDVPENFYFQYNDVLEAMERYVRTVGDKPTVTKPLTEDKIIPPIIEGLIAGHKLHFIKIDDSSTYEDVAILIASRLIIDHSRKDKPTVKEDLTVADEEKAHCNCQNGFIHYQDRGRLCANCGREMR